MILRSSGLLFVSSCLATAVGAQQSDARPHTVAVTVTDSKGKPAVGVPLVLGHLGAIGESQDFRRLGKDAWTTDARGQVVIPIPAGTVPDGLHLQALVVAEPPVRRSLAALPATLALDLPPCGQVRVLVYDDKERPRSDVVTVTLRLVGNQRFFDQLDVPAAMQPEGAMFRWVALGLRVEARALLQGVTGALVVPRPGPTRAGELVVVDLRQQEGRLIRARLIGLDGKPLPAMRLGLVTHGGNSCLIADATTDAEGHFAYQASGPHAAALGASIVLLRRGGGSSYEGAIEIPLGDGWTGERDLGDVRLQPEPVVACGRIVDPDGRPIAGVPLSADLSPRPGQIGLEVRTRDGWGHRVVTGADGTFELREPPGGAGQIALEVTGGWLLPEPCWLRVGGTPVDVRVVRPGRIRLHLVGVPAGVQVGQVQWFDEAEAAQMRGSMVSWPEMRVTGAGGVLEFPDLRPGKWRLAIGSGLGRAPFDLQGIEVPAGADSPDPRLPCDTWREHLQLLTIRVVDQENRPAKGHVMVCDVAANGHSAYGVPIPPPGPVQILVARGRRLLLTQPGCRSIVIADPPDEVEFRLLPRPQVTLGVSGDRRLPAGLRVQVISKELAFLELGQVEGATGGDAELMLRPEMPGPAAVTISAPVGDGTWTPVWQGAITVADTVEPQRVELPLSAEEFVRVRDAAGGKR